jgi:signal transduction histidine kinase
MKAREIVNLSPVEIGTVVDVANAIVPFEEEIAQRWHDLCVESLCLHQTEQRPPKAFRAGVRLMLTSLSGGDFDRYLKQLQRRGREFAKAKEKYEDLVLYFGLYEYAALPYLLKAFPQRIDSILRTLEHLYHGIVALMSRAYFKELEKDREKFVASLVHDLRNPLVCVTWNAKRMVEKSLSKEEEAKLARVIRKSGDRMSAIIDNALTYGSLKGGKITLHVRSVDVMDIIKEAAMFLLPECEESGIRVSINGSLLRDWDFLPPVAIDGDRELLLRAVGNYLSNAVKYANTKVAVNVRKEDNNIHISVNDDGPGIPPQHFPLIFNAYHVVPEGKPGTGIGLSSVAMIVRLHNGEVKVESENGLGTTFHMILPKVNGKSETKPDHFSA